MKNIKYFIFLVILSNCMNSNVERVRIVDSQGNPAKINKMVPKFNEEQLAKQKEAVNNANSGNIEVNKFRQDFNTQPINTPSDPNMIMPSANKYPNDVFADRITNYNYIQEAKTKPQVGASSANEIIEGDIVDNKKEPAKPATTVAKPKPTVAATTPSTVKKTPSGYYIQIGVYGEKKNADNAYSKYSKIGAGTVAEATIKNKKQYTVQLGPYANKKLAEKDMEKVIKTGHYDVYITEKK